MYVDFYGYKSISPSYITDLDALASTANDGAAPRSFKINTDFASGGLSVTWYNNTGYLPYQYKINMGEFPGNGMSFQFGGYNCNTQNTDVYGYRIFMLTLSSSTDFYNAATGSGGYGNYGKPKPGVPMFLINTNTGTFYLASTSVLDGSAHDVKQVLIQNDALKYENFSDKPFRISFVQNEYNQVYAIITVQTPAGDIVLSGKLDMDKLKTFNYYPSANTFMTFGGINFSNTECPFSVIFYGHKTGVNDLASVPQFSDLASNLDDVASVSKNLETTANSGYKVTAIPEGGVTLNYTVLSGYFPYQYATNMGGFPDKGISLFFGDYTNKNTDHSVFGDGIILLTLSRTTIGFLNKLKPGVPGIAIDTKNGTAKLIKRTSDSMVATNIEDVQTIITSNILKYDNIKEKNFIVTFNTNSNNQLTLIINVDGTTVSGVIDRANWESLSGRPTATNTYVGIGGLDNNSLVENKWSVNFYGYATSIDKEVNSTVIISNASAVINAVNGLPAEVTLDCAADILNAKAMYDSLSEAEKSSVINAGVLEEAYAAICSLRSASYYKPTSTFLANESTFTNQYPHEGMRTTFSSATDDGFAVEFKRASGADVLR